MSKVFSFPISIAGKAWFKEVFPAIPVPLNVACPRCSAPAGAKCRRKQLFPKPWGTKKPQRRAFEYQSEQLPHNERIKQAKLKEVEDKLDRI